MAFQDGDLFGGSLEPHADAELNLALAVGVGGVDVQRLTEFRLAGLEAGEEAVSYTHLFQSRFFFSKGWSARNLFLVSKSQAS